MINKVAQFEKVSYKQFYKDMKDCSNIGYTDSEIKEAYYKIRLPERATTGSAGHDFFTPVDVEISTGKTIHIPTGIRVKIDEGWWLECLPKSGLGCKYRLQLDNTCGVIDGDYYFSDNEGDIQATITLDAKTEKTLSLSAGSKFMQGVFLPYGITHNDNANGIRNGGFGSTGVK